MAKDEEVGRCRHYKDFDLVFLRLNHLTKSTTNKITLHNFADFIFSFFLSTRNF